MSDPRHILFLGASDGNSVLRSHAMERRGHKVTLINPAEALPTGRLIRKFHFETGAVFLEKRLTQYVLDRLPQEPVDLVWVDSGRYVGPSLVRDLKRRYGKIVNYNTDDPLGTRDRNSWALYRKSVPEYDLLVFNRKENEDEAKARGAKRVRVDFRTADEIQHQPRPLTPEEAAKWTHDVVFVGTGMEERPEFMVELIRLGMPLTIFGNSWERGIEKYPEIKAAWKGPGTKGPQEYAASILGAKVCLGLLSKGNRDLHTRRSIEIPALGSVLCAERTSEHLELYVENEEAIFWETPEECVAACNRLLADEDLRQKIARQGHERCLRNGHFNETFCQRVIDDLLAH